MLTQGRLKELFNYNHLTGEFTRLVALSRCKVGEIAGSTNFYGYIQISIDNKLYKAHRLAWLYMVGIWPSKFIDHVNGQRDDNMFSNLREATNSENMRNSGRHKNNTSGFKGVSWFARDKCWRAYSSIGGKRKHLGYFDTPESASAAYEEFARKNHGEFYYATS